VGVAFAHTAVDMATGTRGGEGAVGTAVSAGVIAAAIVVLQADRRGHVVAAGGVR
jgi:hypothetical protein